MSLLRRILTIGAAAAVLVVGLVSVAAAQDVEATQLKTASLQVGEPSEVAGSDQAEGFLDEEFEFFDDWEPTAEELAEINAETDALVEYLQGLGYDVTAVADEAGFRYFDVDESVDESFFEAMDDFYRARFADEVAGWSAEEKADWNAATDAFVAELEAMGVTVQTEEIGPGVHDIVWTEELNEAMIGLDDGMLFGDPFDEGFDDWEPTAEELAEMNAETEALAEYLQGLGHEVTVTTDELGFTYLDFDESADESIFDAMEDFYRARFADEVAGWSAEEKADWNAGLDELVAELANEGITVETEEIAPGVYDIVWTEEIDEALFPLEGDVVLLPGEPTDPVS